MTPTPFPARLEANDEAAARRFVTRLVVLLATCIAVAAIVNATIDPHGVHRWIDIEGLNRIKPRANQAPEAFKYRAIDVKAPQTLLLGNSRVELGWNPDDLPHARFGRTVNAAIPGRGLSSMVALADHAWARSRPEQLIVGLEFFDCLASGPRPKRQETHVSPWSVAQPPYDFHVRRAKEMLEDVFSIDTLTDSFTTALAQYDKNAPHLRDDGFQTARNFPAIVRIDGVRKMFTQHETEIVRARARGPKSIRYADGTPSKCLEALNELLAGARERDQTVFLATFPYHARLLEIIVQADLLPAFEDWKREITLAAEKARNAGGRVSLRGFDGYHLYASEAVESAGVSAREMRWYWEAGHFKASLGRAMLAVMIGADPPQPDFGEEMTPASIDAQLVAFRTGRARFLAEQPDTVAEIGAAIARQQ